MKRQNKDKFPIIVLGLVAIFIIFSKITYSGQSVRYTNPQAAGYQSSSSQTLTTQPAIPQPFSPTCVSVASTPLTTPTTGEQLCNQYAPGSSCVFSLAAYQPGAVKVALIPCNSPAPGPGQAADRSAFCCY